METNRRDFLRKAGTISLGLGLLPACHLISDTMVNNPCSAAFGFETFRMGGVYGHHAETMMRGNLLQLDMEKITLDPASVSDPKAEQGVVTTTVQGWLGKPGESTTRNFVFRTFDQPEGRKIYFNLSQPSAAVKDELFAAALHEESNSLI